MENLIIKIGREDKLISDAFLIRGQVFQKEQGISKDLDFDGKDIGATHLVAYHLEQAVGCARVRHVENRAKLERIALLKEYRGNGNGKEIVVKLIDYSRTLPINEIYFDAQAYLQGFYEKLGFNARGEVFQEAGIPHIEMYMEL